MPEIADYALILISEIIRLIITGKYCDSSLDRNTKSTYHLVCYFISLVITFAAYISLGIAWVNLLATFLGLLILLAPYRASFPKKFAVAIIILAVSTVLDLLAAFMFTANPHNNHYSILSTVTSVLLFLLAEQIVERLSKSRKEVVVVRYWRIFILLLFVSIIAMLVLATDLTISKVSVLAISSAILILNLSVIYLYDKIIESVANSYETMVLKEQMKAYSNELSLRSENEKKIKALRHDMRHHLNEISLIVESGDKNRLNEYLTNISDTIIETKPFADCGNPAIDSILNYLLGQARTSGIKTNLHIMVPENLSISEFDMNIILGNLLENAIEACQKVSDPWIDIAFKYNDGLLFIEISNPYSGAIIKRDSAFATTKQDASVHGIGVYSVREAVKRNNGTISFDTENQIFKVDVLLDLSNFT